MSVRTTIADLLSSEFPRLPVQLVAGIDETPELRSLKSLLTMRLSSVQWASLVQLMAGRVQDLLRIPLRTILVRAWKDVREVRDAIETTRQSPDRTELVALADHSIESEHRPYLDLHESGNFIGRITFPVSLEIELRGLLLEIGMGAIRKMESGDVRIKGTLKVGDFTLLEKAFERVRIPGEIPFDNPTVEAARPH